MNENNLVVAALLAGTAGFACAQDAFPTRPITLVLPFPPGGIGDLTARPLASAMEKVLKQPVVVANRPGAAGAVGTQFVAVAKPDGYTIVVGLTNLNTTPEVDAVFGRKPVFTRDQFAPIARINADPPIMVLHPSLPAKGVKDVVALAKSRPNEIVYSTSGPYGASHVPMLMLMKAGGVTMRHLPTTGGGPAMTAVLGGHAMLWASPPGVAAPHLKAGKVRALGGWGEKRLANFPDLPTMKELGYDVEYYLWVGIFAPRATPQPVLNVLRNAIRHAVADADFKAAKEKLSVPIAYQDSEEFRRWFDEDARRLAAVIKQVGRVE